jgi:hypothetical protein
MKRTLASLAALALTVLATGCATDLEKREDMARAAGFKVITPHTPDQVALLPLLPPKMSLLNYHGQPVYVLPNVEKNRAYVGGQKQYDAYRAMRETEHLEGDHPGTPQMAALNFGGWDGGNVVGPDGGMGFSKH